MAGIAARRHAQAVFQIALENDQLEKWRSDLRFIASVFGDSQLISILEDPKVGFEDKKSLVKRCLPGISELALNLTYLLLNRRRVRIAGQIADEYEDLVDAHQGLEHAEVTTAVPIDEESKDRIRERLAEITGNKLVVTAKVDPDIIGGFVARIGDQLIDGSIRSRLEELRQSVVAR